MFISLIWLCTRLHLASLSTHHGSALRTLSSQATWSLQSTLPTSVCHASQMSDLASFPRHLAFIWKNPEASVKER